jgi:phosphate transport system substrate-binding protein
MLVLNRRLAEGFMRLHPGTSIEVRGGGSSVGVEALVAGTIDICAASRPLAPSEVEALYGRSGTLGVRFVVAEDALSIYLNRDNPIHDLSLDQLAGLFDGTVTRWSEVGGADGAVEVVLRPPSSGTFRFFQDHVLKGRPYGVAAVTAASTNDVVQAVSSRPGAIGFGGLAYGHDLVVHCAIEGVAPSVEAVRSGRYRLARYLQLYTAAPPRGLVRDFIEWCLGRDGQAIVSEVGYLPLWERRRDAG